MTCIESGVNVDCLLMRKVPQLRYQYFMNIEQTKNRHRKQTRGSTFGGIVSEMRRSLGGAKISQGEAKCVRYQECTELAGKGWSSRPIEYRMVSSFCRVAGYAERSGRQ